MINNIFNFLFITFTNRNFLIRFIFFIILTLISMFFIFLLMVIFLFHTIIYPVLFFL